MEITCAICGKQLTRFNALRIGGMVEQITGKRFMCRECVGKKIEYRVVAK